MTGNEVYKIETQHPDIIVVDSEAPGLKYLFDGDKSRFVIAGKEGMVMLTIKQAKALKNELGDILELYAT